MIILENRMAYTVFCHQVRDWQLQPLFRVLCTEYIFRNDKQVFVFTTYITITHRGDFNVTQVEPRSNSTLKAWEPQLMSEWFISDYIRYCSLECELLGLGEVKQCSGVKSI